MVGDVRLIAQVFPSMKTVRCMESRGSTLLGLIKTTIKAMKPVAVGLGNYANSANIC